MDNANHCDIQAERHRGSLYYVYNVSITLKLFQPNIIKYQNSDNNFSVLTILLMLISYKITSLVLSEEPMSLHFIKTDSGIQRKHTTESSVNLSLTVINMIRQQLLLLSFWQHTHHGCVVSVSCFIPKSNCDITIFQFSYRCI